MTLTLELPLDMEAQTATEAAQKGVPLPDYLVAVIRERNQRVSEGLETYSGPLCQDSERSIFKV